MNILDQRFKKLLRSDVTVNDGDDWWDRSVLKFAGNEYCEYMRKAYEIKVTCME